MTVNSASNEQPLRKQKIVYRNGASQAVYGLGMLGAWFYYFTTATTFWMGALGFIKGIFWPAFLVFELMKYLGM